MATDKHMISTQAVGLLAILAVSGTVALLTFGKRKFLCHVLGLSDTHSGPTPSSETAPQSNLVTPEQLKNSSADEKPRQTVLKKVRFAPDVVDPVGDGQVYRSKNKLAYSKKACADKQEYAEGCQGGTRSICGGKCKRGHPSSDCQKQLKPETVAKPKLPANRMVLYKGMQRYRSMLEVDCRS